METWNFHCETTHLLFNLVWEGLALYALTGGQGHSYLARGFLKLLTEGGILTQNS